MRNPETFDPLRVLSAAVPKGLRQWEQGLYQQQQGRRALFTEELKGSSAELAFKYAVMRINKDRNLLPNVTFQYDIQYVPRGNSFRAAKMACHLIKEGAATIFGPSDPVVGGHIQSLADSLDIPHIESRLDLETDVKDFSINLHPDSQVMGNSLKDLVSYLNWTKIAVLYQDDISLINLQELVRPFPPKNVEYQFRRAENFTATLLDIRSRGIYSMIVDVRPENLTAFLRAILQIQLNDYKYHYHFATYDIEAFNLEDFQYNFVNITAFRMVDSDNETVRAILNDMEKFTPYGQNILNKTNVITTEAALTFDAVYAFAHGMNDLSRATQLRPSNVSCEEGLSWSEGTSLFNLISMVDYHGLTGKIRFNEGNRTSLKLDLLKLRQDRLVKVGEWTSHKRLNIINHGAFHDFGTTNITLRVTTIESVPFMMPKKQKAAGGHQLDTSSDKGKDPGITGGFNRTGNIHEDYEGYIMDLLNKLAEKLGFHYDLYLVPDNKFGVENTTTLEWNGMVREIIEKNADLAVAPMTINFARESVIDFTKPFMNLGIQILFKLPSGMPVRLFSFMSPLDTYIWMYVLCAYVLVSCTMFLVARFSPYEWKDPHPCVKESGLMENQFSLGNSFWFTIVTLMHQGCDLNPKATSTRMVGTIWWFFTLILISSYTANLAAFLTVERMITPIESVEDLAEQSKIAYGTLDSGSTMTFFRDSKLELYRKMWRYMKNRPSVFVSTYEEGVERVLQGNYAFLMESTMLDYKVQRDCNLTAIGTLLDNKGYGIGTPIGSPWRDKLSLAILDLQEKGVTQELYNKWWKAPGLTCSRDEKNKEGKANALGIGNIGGVFVVLLVGLAFAILIAIFEFIWNARNNSQVDRQSLCTEMANELRFAVRCGASRQRPAFDNSHSSKRRCSKCLKSGGTFVPSALDLPFPPPPPFPSGIHHHHHRENGPICVGIGGMGGGRPPSPYDYDDT
ncbi:glutamate receptor ionotropic, kainate 2 [Galendromus occidentalis]|uniref:Glutamate receptor ionotropic, kainate 2 n=1 Tax=Galendromus occidentalis TaxID=34638 RepID=A0AAJ7SIF5_9ACAR|nr:glutamate receptor ionotropic, kainate 2 [Galendromus occidentalis]